MLRVRIAVLLRARESQLNICYCVACTELLPVLLLLSQLFQAAVLSHSTFPKQTANRVVVDRYSLMFAYFNSCVHLRAMPCVSRRKVSVTNRLCATSTVVSVYCRIPAVTPMWGLTFFSTPSARLWVHHYLRAYMCAQRLGAAANVPLRLARMSCPARARRSRCLRTMLAAAQLFLCMLLAHIIWKHLPHW